MQAKPTPGARVLAQSPSCRAQQCGHGVVHLTVGRLTLRLQPAELEELAETLGAAALQLRVPDGAVPTRLLC